MMRWTRSVRGAVSVRRAVLLALVGVFIAAGVCGGIAQSTSNNASNDAEIQVDVMKSLDSERFKDVKASVQDGVVKLSGTVDLYSAKLDADNRAHHRKNVKGVENEIKVAGPEVDD